MRKVRIRTGTTPGGRDYTATRRTNKKGQVVKSTAVSEPSYPYQKQNTPIRKAKFGGTTEYSRSKDSKTKVKVTHRTYKNSYGSPIAGGIVKKGPTTRAKKLDQAQ